MKKEFGIGALLVAVCIVLAIVNPRFLSPFNLSNQAKTVGEFGIFGIGMGIIIIVGGIDLSVGSAFALEGVVLSILLQDWHWNWVLAAGAAVLLMLLLGVFHSFMVTTLKLQPFIVTLCGLLIYRGLARGVAHDEARGFTTANAGLLSDMYSAKLLGIPMPFIILIVISIIMWVVLHRSVYGRYLFAIGRNEQAARFSGINTNLIVGSAYVISMALAAISGIIFAFDTMSITPSNSYESYELYGIAAAVLGGCSLRGGEGSILGILLGTMLLVVLQNLVNLVGIPSSQNFTVMGVVILLGVTVDQLLGARKKRVVIPKITGPTSGGNIPPENVGTTTGAPVSE